MQSCSLYTIISGLIVLLLNIFVQSNLARTLEQLLDKYFELWMSDEVVNVKGLPQKFLHLLIVAIRVVILVAYFWIQDCYQILRELIEYVRRPFALNAMTFSVYLSCWWS